MRLPILLPVRMLSNNTNNRITLPVKLPIVFVKSNSNGVKLPITLPISFSQSNVGIKLPITLPIVLSNDDQLEKHEFKIKTKEVAQTVEVFKVKLKNKETAWNFKGLLIEENVVSKMTKPLTLIEDVRGRILIDSVLTDRSTVNISWYGDKVPSLEVYKKISVDEKYDLFKICNWEDESVDISLDSSEYNIKVLGSNSTGESSVLTIGELNSVLVDPSINISINEKIYQFDVNCKSKFKIKVDF